MLDGGPLKFGGEFDADNIVVTWRQKAAMAHHAGYEAAMTSAIAMATDEEGGLPFWLVAVVMTLGERGTIRADGSGALVRTTYGFTCDQIEALSAACAKAREAACTCSRCVAVYEFVERLPDIAAEARDFNLRRLTFEQGTAEIDALVDGLGLPNLNKPAPESAPEGGIYVALYSMEYTADPEKGMVSVGRRLSVEDAAAILPSGAGSSRKFETATAAARHVHDLQQKLCFKFDVSYPSIVARSFIGGEPPETI